MAFTIPRRVKIWLYAFSFNETWLGGVGGIFVTAECFAERVNSIQRYIYVLFRYNILLVTNIT